MVRLAPEHDLVAFDCGDEYYNSWLARHAREADSRGTSAVYLLVCLNRDGVDPTVCGYFAICPTMVQRADAPNQIKRSIMRQAPGWLLAKLALDRSLQGGTWGRELLREAIEEIVRAADSGGGQVIIVDAENEKVFAWYRAQGFLGTGMENLRLYMKVSTARSYLNP
jgi:ribosomal protein S18 acetylase RimI-like enzyme